jgi:hypothetical protein
MLKASPYLLIVTFFLNASYPQTHSHQLDTLNAKYKAFAYQEVTEMAASMLNYHDEFTTTELCQILRLKANAHYALTDMRSALNSFISLLQLDSDYQLNPRYNSPKIVEFFEEIRSAFRSSSLVKQASPDISSETTTVLLDTVIMTPTNFNRRLGYSLVLPGLGHLNRGQSRKGWILMGASLLSLGSGAYYAIETKNREDEYLKATEKTDIEEKYSRYNEAYKLRDLSFLSFATVWVYTQIDILFFSGDYDRRGFKMSLVEHHQSYSIQFQYQF